MKKLFATLAVVAFSAAAAQAQTAAVRWFLSPDGLSDGNDPGSAAVNPASFGTNPTVNGGGRLYLWANMHGPATGTRIWNGFQNYAFNGTGDVSITDVAIYNDLFDTDGDPDDPSGDVPRWASVNDSGTSGVTFFFVSGNQGIRTGANLAGIPDVHYISGIRSALVGHIEFTGTNGEIRITHSLASAALTTGGIATANTFVRLGFGDEGTVYTGGAGGDSPIAEATVIPEPASLALLGLAALALRRR